MASSEDGNDDHALLARLNALKKSTIDLNTKRYGVSTSNGNSIDEKGRPAFEPSQPDISVDPAPARALHTDLASRFKSLNGQPDIATGTAGTPGGQAFDLMADEDGKTVEDLLAELGSEDSWNVSKDEETQIKDLLKTAHEDLQSSKIISADSNKDMKEDPDRNENTNSAQVPSTQPLAQSSPPKPAEVSEEDVDHEADEYLAQVLDELRHQPKQDFPEDQLESSKHISTEERSDQQADTSTSVNFPQAPDKDIELPPSYSETTADDELASRFANLGLPSVPRTIKSTPANPATQASKQSQNTFTDEEIDSWCIICNDDASLRCIGCDGDLYCTKCWLDGHKGPDAGYEERKHRAVQYNKGGGMKKQPARRTLLGA